MKIRTKTAFLRARSTPVELIETFSSDCPPASLCAHLERLRASAAAFGIAYDRDALASALDFVRADTALRIVRIRLRADGSFTLRDEPPATQPSPVAVCLWPERVSSGDLLLRHKTSWRPIHDRASAFARARDCFNALLRNELGQLTEGSRTNLFIERGGELWTPPLACGALPGILRSRIVSEGRARERELTFTDLTSADAIYVGNSARGLLHARLVLIDE